STIVCRTATRRRPAGTAAKIVQARVPSARLGPRLGRQAARGNEPGARPSGAAPIVCEHSLGLIMGCLHSTCGSIGRLRGLMPCDMVRPPAPARALNKLNGDG